LDFGARSRCTRGDLEAACAAGLNDGGTGPSIPSRGISQAPDPAAAAKELRDNIQAARERVAHGKKQMSEEESAIYQYQKEFLEFSLDQGVLKFGAFVLKSGRSFSLLF
jgi:hypothetical protein